MYNLKLYRLLHAFLNGRLDDFFFKVWEYDLFEHQIVTAIESFREGNDLHCLLSHLHNHTLHQLLDAFRALKQKRIPHVTPRK